MGLKAAHSPEAPAAWPRSLMALALPSGSPGCVGSSRGYPFCQTTGLNCSFCGLPDGHVASGASFSATPATTPEPLIRLAQPLLPPSVGSALMTPFCHRNGTQVVPEDERPSALKPQKSSPSGTQVVPEDERPSALKPQKSSPFGFGVVVWASPTASPKPFTPKAWLFGPWSPCLPRSIILPLYQSTACNVLPFCTAPATRPSLVMTNGCPFGPTVPRSMTL